MRNILISCLAAGLLFIAFGSASRAYAAESTVGCDLLLPADVQREMVQSQLDADRHNRVVMLFYFPEWREEIVRYYDARAARAEERLAAGFVGVCLDGPIAHAP